MTQETQQDSRARSTTARQDRPGDPHAAATSATVAIYDQETEEYLLGLLLLDGALISAVLAEHLAPDDFFIVRNGWIFDAMRAVHQGGATPDYPTVAAMLAARESTPGESMLDAIGGAAHLTWLFNNAIGLAAYYGGKTHAAAAARIIRNFADLRRFMVYLSTSAQDIYQRRDQAAIEIWADMMRGLTNLRPFTGQGGIVRGVDSVAYYDKLTSDAALNPAVFPVPFESLSEVCPVYGPGDILIIAGARGSGKSAMSMHWAHAYAQARIRGLYVHTEMDSQNVLARRKAAFSKLSYHKLLRPDQFTDHDWAEFHAADETIGEFAPYIDYYEAGAIDGWDLLAELKHMIESDGLQVIFIDGLNDLSFDVPRGKTAVGVIREFMAALETFARTHQVLIIGTVQLNRSGDIYGSAAFEQKAALVLKIHVETARTNEQITYQGRTFGAFPGEYSLFRRVEVDKNRRGPTGRRVDMVFLGAIFTWIDRAALRRDAHQAPEVDQGDHPTPILLPGVNGETESADAGDR